jgi:hypothetical protein
MRERRRLFEDALTKEGIEISSDSFLILARTENYFQDFYVNDENEIVKIVNREKT